MLHSASRAGATAILLSSLPALTSAAEASHPAPCKVLPAAEASRIVGTPLRSQMSSIPGDPSCIYFAKEAISGFGVLSYASESAAKAMFKRCTTASDSDRDVAFKKAAGRSRPPQSYRQKVVFVFSANGFNGDGSKLDTLFDAAAKHL